MSFFRRIENRISIGDLWHFGILGLFLFAMFEFGQGLENNYREIIICVIILATCLSLLGIKMWTSIKLHQFAFVFLVVVGLLSLVIQPIFNIPDEVAHFARAEFISRGNIIIEPNQTEYDTIQAVIDLHDNLKKTYPASTIKEESIDYTATKIGHIAASNASFLYLPQTLGILLAKILGLDIIWMLWMARLGNLLGYALIIHCALKIAPKLKFMLFFIASMPMCVQQAASCSPDAIINASAILLIAYFLSLYCAEDKEISWKQLIIYFAVSVVVTISKVTNIFMVAMILFVPLEKNAHIRRAILSKCLIIGGAIAIGVLHYVHGTNFPTSPEHLAYLQAIGANSSEQIHYIFDHFGDWFRGFGASLVNNFNGYVDGLGTFGWLEYGNSLIPIMTVFLFGKICTQEEGIFLNRVNKVLLTLMVLGIYATTCLALYISWTPVGSEEILGVQGRYFIPMLALTALLFTTSTNCVITQQKRIGDVVAVLSMNGAMLVATALRYY